VVMTYLENPRHRRLLGAVVLVMRVFLAGSPSADIQLNV
jgi:hypothetical protein